MEIGASRIASTDVGPVRGWVVFRLKLRGSGGYGERFLRANLGGWVVGDYRDVMTGVDHLISSSVADPDRWPWLAPAMAAT